MPEHPSALANFPAARRWLFTADEFHRLGQAGILGHEDRVELIDGELIAMAPIGSYHQGTVNQLYRVLSEAAGDDAVVACQGPVRLDDHNEPQPDFALLRPRDDFYKRSHPTPSDVLLLIEVADSSLAYDRQVKASLYARHAIHEFWIVDLAANKVIIHRDPRPDGYADMTESASDVMLKPSLLPGAAISVGHLFR